MHKYMTILQDMVENDLGLPVTHSIM